MDQVSKWDGIQFYQVIIANEQLQVLADAGARNWLRRASPPAHHTTISIDVQYYEK